MRERISQLMDGELARAEAQRALAALRSDREAREAWHTYHLISDSLRETWMLSRGFTERVAARLAEEPTVLVPTRALPWLLARAAAVAAALVFVGLGVLVLRQAGPGPQIAQSPKPAAVATAEPAPAHAAKEPAHSVLPEGALDYLLAHQGYAPRYALQGYARTVSDVVGNRR